MSNSTLPTNDLPPSCEEVFHFVLRGELLARDFPTAQYEEWATQFTSLAFALPTARTATGLQVYFRSTPKSAKQFPPPSNHPLKWVMPPTTGFPFIHHPADAGLLTLFTPTDPLWRLLTSPDSPATSADPSCAPDMNGLPRGRNRTQTWGKIEAQNTLPSRHNIPLDGQGGVTTEGSPPRPTKNARITINTTYTFFEKFASHARATQPTSPDQVSDCLFRYAQAVLGEEEFLTLEQHEQAFQQWWDLAGSIVGEDQVGGVNADYYLCVANVRLPGGMNPAKVRQYTKWVEFGGNTKLYKGNQLLLAQCCVVLHRWSGGRPFWLSCEFAGELMGVTPMAAWKSLNGLQQKGGLAKVTNGKKGSPQQRGVMSSWQWQGEYKWTGPTSSFRPCFSPTD